MKTIISIFILIFGCGIYLNGQSTSYEIVQYFPSNRQWSIIKTGEKIKANDPLHKRAYQAGSQVAKEFGEKNKAK